MTTHTKPRDLNAHFGVTPEIHRMKVKIGEQIVSFYVLPQLIPSVGYISEPLAEHIKQTFAPTHSLGHLDYAWEPYQAKHKHIPCDPLEDANCRTNTKGFDKRGRISHRAGADPCRSLLSKIYGHPKKVAEKKPRKKRERNVVTGTPPSAMKHLHHESILAKKRRDEKKHTQKQSQQQQQNQEDPRNETISPLPDQTPGHLHPQGHPLREDPRPQVEQDSAEYGF